MLIRTTGREENVVHHYKVLGEFAQLAADRTFSIPVAGNFAMKYWHKAFKISLSGRAQGKLLVLRR